MIINHNMNAMNAQRQMSVNNSNSSKAMEKLSSGLRINRAGDDAAGLAISEKMRGQIRGLDQASRNAQDGISLIQTAEGALNETHSILQRMNELATQSANDTNVDIDRTAIQKEMDELSKEITRISDTTEFNEQKLLNGNFSNKKFQIGANGGQSITFSISSMSAKDLFVDGSTFGEATLGDYATVKNANGEAVTIAFATAQDATGTGVSETKAEYDEDSNTITITLKQDASEGGEAGDITATKQEVIDALSGLEGFKLTVTAEKDVNLTAKAEVIADDIEVAAGVEDRTTGINVSTQSAANTAIETIQAAIDTVSKERSLLGATQNRLDHTINNLNTSSENLTAAESRIRDVDMAKEMMNFSKNNILSQAAQAMVAQANQQPQGVLQLLR